MRHICPAAEVLRMAVGEPMVNCYICRRMEEGAILFPLEGCMDYINCSVWQNAKNKGQA